MDYRKADPNYVNFKPTTAEAAIDKFYRHKKLGVPPSLWPEVFVKCAAALPAAELQKFEEWLVNPQGTPSGAAVAAIDAEALQLHNKLAAEAERRDMAPVPEQDDEKVALEVVEDHFEVLRV